VRGSLKASPWSIIRAQNETYVDARTGKTRWQDYAVFYGVPAVVAGISAWRHVKLSGAASISLLTAAALLAGLFFGVMLQVSERAMQWADESPTPSGETSTHAKYLRELAANSGYASLVCIGAAIAYVVASTTAHRKLEVASAVGLALGFHLVLVLLMVMKRVFALTEERLNRARTGADATVVPHRRRKHGS
jgi:hypothetical protein